MSPSTMIEAWLDASSIPKADRRRIDAPEGAAAWSLTRGAASVTIAAAESDEDDAGGTLFVLTPILRACGEIPAEFLEALLEMQLSGELPPGMMFGFDRESGRIAMTGQLPLGVLDARRFEDILLGALDAAGRLAEELRAMMREIEDAVEPAVAPGEVGAPGEAPSLRPAPGASSPAVPAAPGGPGVPDASRLSDAEFLEMHLTEFLRV